MSVDDFARDIEGLMADSRLIDLCEMPRTGDEVLDVISLSENQHSDLLSWMLDPREGHGQGDGILRDLLVYASATFSGGESKLRDDSDTAQFFEKWPASRIRTTSFGSAFTARELGMRAKERVDIFVIDVQNKLILLIENKSGTQHKKDQLDSYMEKFNSLRISNVHLNDYSIAYIALDRDFDGDRTALTPVPETWLHLGYDWLKTSAARALMHVERGNAAARLVVSYCNRQTDWENPLEAKSLKIAADLHQSYPLAIKHLLEFSRGRTERNWLVNGSATDSHLLFVLQNKSAITLLKETQGMAAVSAAILGKFSSLPRGNVIYKRAWLNMCPTGWEKFEGEGWWPVFFNVFFAEKTRSQYNLTLCWDSRYARTHSEAEQLRHLLEKVEADFCKHSRSLWRNVMLGKNLILDDLLKTLGDYDVKLEKSLQSLETVDLPGELVTK